MSCLGASRRFTTRKQTQITAYAALALAIFDGACMVGNPDITLLFALLATPREAENRVLSGLAVIQAQLRLLTRIPG